MRRYSIQLRPEAVRPGMPNPYVFETEELSIRPAYLMIQDNEGIIETIFPTGSVEKITYVEIPDPEPEEEEDSVTEEASEPEENEVHEEEDVFDPRPGRSDTEPVHVAPTSRPVPLSKPVVRDHDHHSHVWLLATACILVALSCALIILYLNSAH